jgi:hypothetical protein
MILESDKALHRIDPYAESGGDWLLTTKPVSTKQTESGGVLDSLFGTLEKGADLWTKWQVSKNNLTAEQIRQTSVTDVNRQPSADTGDTIFGVDKRIVIVGGLLLVGGGVLLYLNSGRK